MVRQDRAVRVQELRRSLRLVTGVPVRDHDALRACRGAAGVVDRDQVPFGDLRPVEAGIGGRHRRLVVEPAVPGAGRAPVQGHVVLYPGHPVADAVHRRQVLLGHAEHGGAGVVHDVDEVLRGQPVVDRHQDGAELRHRVEGLQLRVRVRRDRGHPVALRHAEPLQRRGPAVAAIEELPVGQPEITVDDRLPVCVQPAGTAGEVQRRQRRFHACDSDTRFRPAGAGPPGGSRSLAQPTMQGELSGACRSHTPAGFWKMPIEGSAAPSKLNRVRLTLGEPMFAPGSHGTPGIQSGAQ